MNHLLEAELLFLLFNRVETVVNVGVGNYVVLIQLPSVVWYYELQKIGLVEPFRIQIPLLIQILIT